MTAPSSSQTIGIGTGTSSNQPSETNTTRIPIWLDCDPGHDDAIAILLSLHLPNIQLLGISTVHGNASLRNTTLNAARCLQGFGGPEDIKVFPGCEEPLVRNVEYAPEIHGDDGLGGVTGLPDADDAAVGRRVQEGKKAVLAMADAVEGVMKEGKAGANGRKLRLVATGALTNVALFVKLYPELVRDGVDEIVCMGGVVGIGNYRPTAEFNIHIDPEAAQIVFDAPVKTVLIPLNVTHTNLFLTSYHHQLARGSVPPRPEDEAEDDPAPAIDPRDAITRTRTRPESGSGTTPLRRTLCSILTFFYETYRDVFNFNDGPPVHDALTIAYVARPDLFRGGRWRVEVERGGEFTAGTTVVDYWGWRNRELERLNGGGVVSEAEWGRKGKNVWVAESVEVEEFWKMFFECIDRADSVL